MAEVKWIKIVTDIFDNRKIKQIEQMPEGDTIIVIWFKLMCLSGTINDGGLVYLTKDIPYTEEMLSAQFNRPLSTVRLALATYVRFGMIEIVDNVLMLSSWEKYQSADKLDKIREQTRKRVSDFRDRQKQLADCNVTDRYNVTQCNATEEERDIEEEIDIDINKNSIFLSGDGKIETPDEPDFVRRHRESMQRLVEAGAISAEASTAAEGILKLRAQRGEFDKEAGT